MRIVQLVVALVLAGLAPAMQAPRNTAAHPVAQTRPTPAVTRPSVLPTAMHPSATQVVLHGHIHTLAADQPTAQAIAVVDDRIVAVGSDSDIQPWIGPQTQVIDAQGRLVLPGFNDDHVHFLGGGLQLSSVDLRDANTQEEFARRICDFAARLKPGEWMTGGDWDDQRWNPPQLPTRQSIDACTPNTAVFVNRFDGHMALANSRALQLANVTAATPTPAGGVIVTDAAGQPTGILKDAAQGLVYRVQPPLSDAQLEQAAVAALRHAAGLGLTTIQDTWPMPAEPARVLTLYQRLLDNGWLTARLSVRFPLSNWREFSNLGIRNHFGGNQLMIGAMKEFADGSLGSSTAYFFQPYSDDPRNRGILSEAASPPEKLYNNMLAADKAGLQLSIHAIGDAANSMVLDFYQRIEAANGPRDRRPRIEHAQHLVPQDFDRFARLGVIASVQPYHAIDDGRFAERRIGHERARTSYAFRTFLDHHVHLAFGTDWDVAPLNPLLGIYASVTRETLDGKNPNGWFPEQKLSVDEAVRAYTLGSAYAAFQERDLGTLQPGKLADYVILDRDIFQIRPDDIKNARVVKTVVGGRVVFTQGDYPVTYDK